MNDSVHTGERCRSCGAPVAWVKTTAGKWMPLNPKRLTIVTDEGATLTGRESHYSSCRDADAWRRKETDRG